MITENCPKLSIKRLYKAYRAHRDNVKFSKKNNYLEQQ